MTCKSRNLAVDFLILMKETGGIGSGVRIEGNAVWLTQDGVAELFGCSSEEVRFHLKALIEDGEINISTDSKSFSVFLSKDAQTKTDKVRYWGLGAVIALGLRIKNERAIVFRQWTMRVLGDLTLKGYVLDAERLKGIGVFDSAYFENLIEKIGEIRVSARASYQKVADLFSTSFDYDADSIIARRFYKGLLEKIRFVVQRRSKHASGGDPTEERAVHLRTGTVNFEKLLSAGELKALDRCLAEYLDFAEMRATNKVPTAMEDWEKQLAGFLVFSELGALDLP